MGVSLSSEAISKRKGATKATTISNIIQLKAEGKSNRTKKINTMAFIKKTARTQEYNLTMSKGYHFAEIEHGQVVTYSYDTLEDIPERLKKKHNL